MCFGRGAQYISGHSKTLAVSMGTGTAFVLADGEKYNHPGGSGVGGGTLTGLITGKTESAEINRMILCGNAANAGKKTVSRNESDIAAGIANVIFPNAVPMQVRRERYCC